MLLHLEKQKLSHCYWSPTSSEFFLHRNRRWLAVSFSVPPSEKDLSLAILTIYCGYALMKSLGLKVRYAHAYFCLHFLSTLNFYKAKVFWNLHFFLHPCLLAGILLFLWLCWNIATFFGMLLPPTKDHWNKSDGSKVHHIDFVHAHASLCMSMRQKHIRDLLIKTLLHSSTKILTSEYNMKVVSLKSGCILKNDFWVCCWGALLYDKDEWSWESQWQILED